MTKEQIIHWAIKAHMEASAADENCRVPHFDDVTLEELEAFAKLAAAHERERIIAANAPELERANAHIKALEEELVSLRARST